MTAPLWVPALAEASSVDPTPIPDTIFPGAPFHVQLPVAGNELSTITDFNGVLGVVAVSGTGTGTNTNTGVPTRLVLDADMPFMQGQYIGNGRPEPRGNLRLCLTGHVPSQVGVGQIHDFNLDINPFAGGAGLIWTRRFPEETVAASPESWIAAMIARDVKLLDFFNIGNALADGSTIPAEASFGVVWTGPTGAFTASSSWFRFGGQSTGATVEWSATEAGFAFKSDAAKTSTKNFAIVGREQNGVFKK